MLRIFLLVMMTHLWCVDEMPDDMPLTVPCMWTRHMADCGKPILFDVCKPGEGSVATVIDTCAGDVISVESSQGQRSRGVFSVPYLKPLDHGEVLRAQMCDRYESKSGAAIYTAGDRKEGCLLIKPPGKKAQTVSVDIDNTKLPNILCEYSAQERHFIITKPLVEYVDKSLFFVRLKIAYANPEKPIMVWGKRGPKTDEGSFQEWDIKQKIFDFYPQDKPCDPHQGDGDYIRTRSLTNAASPVRREELRKTETKSSVKRVRKSAKKGGVKRLQN